MKTEEKGKPASPPALQKGKAKMPVMAKAAPATKVADKQVMNVHRKGREIEEESI